MKRLAWLALSMVVAFLGATFADRCALGEGDDRPPTCHLACVDGCAAAPAETAAPELTALALMGCRALESASSPLELDFLPI